MKVFPKRFTTAVYFAVVVTTALCGNSSASSPGSLDLKTRDLVDVDDPSPPPSPLPSTLPSVEPSTLPSLKPSTLPSLGPSVSMNPSKSMMPSSTPSVSMNPSTTVMPSSSPSLSMSPTVMPSLFPSVSPTLAPSSSVSPTKTPTKMSSSDSSTPSMTPITSSSETPSSNLSPTRSPTSSPSKSHHGHSHPHTGSPIRRPTVPDGYVSESERDSNVAHAIGWMAVFAVFGMIFVAYQLDSNPDGICASFCRLMVSLSSCILKVVCFPCKFICGCPSGGDNDRISNPDYRSDYYRNSSQRSNSSMQMT